MPEPNTEDAATLEQSLDLDPRPVFEGDWASASGTAKGMHSRAVQEWYERHPDQRPGVKRQSAKASGSGSGTGDGGREGHEASPIARHADDLADLQAIIDDRRALASDKIRAIESKQRILARVADEEREAEHGPLVALRDAVAQVPEGERVAMLTSLLVVGDAA